MLRQRFSVQFEYPVYFTDDLFDEDNPVLVDAISRKESKRRHRVLVIVDAGVMDAWPGLAERVDGYVAAHTDRLDLVGPVETVQGGEPVKNDPAVVRDMQARLQAHRMDRQAVVVIIGGGAVLDMAGYAAATTHRGVRVVRAPTTVLAQCDGGVGVKTGVNAFDSKNFLGTFTPPFAVINDHRFIGTLGARDKRAGLSECVKVALIRDAPFFDWMEANAAALAAFEPQQMSYAIRRAAELHLAHIADSGDPFEFGTARPLDFGHWAAHKLEVMSDYRLRHGEAVAIGMVLDSRYAVGAGLLSSQNLDRILALLEALGLALSDPALDVVDGEGAPAVLRGLEEFREHLGGELTVAMLDDIGHSVDVSTIDMKQMADAIRAMQSQSGMQDRLQWQGLDR